MYTKHNLHFLPPFFPLRDRPVLTYPIPTLTITACAYDDGNDISDLFLLLLRPLSLHYGRRRWRKRRRCPLLRLPPPPSREMGMCVWGGGEDVFWAGVIRRSRTTRYPRRRKKAKEREGRRRRYHLWPVFSNRPREEMHYCGTNRRYSFVGKEEEGR